MCNYLDLFEGCLIVLLLDMVGMEVYLSFVVCLVMWRSLFERVDMGVLNL